MGQTELLGAMVIWSISKGPHASTKVADRLNEAGFNIAISDTTIGQAWRRATGEALPGYTWTTPQGKRVEASLRKMDVTTSKRLHNRREWQRIVPGYAPRPVMTSTLGKKTRAASRIAWNTVLNAKEINPEERIALTRIRDGLDARVEELLTNLDGSRVRSVVRGTLEGELQGLAMRGGVYYVPQRHTARLEALESVFDVLDDCYLDIVPLIDMPTTRSMVVNLLQRQLEEDVAGFEHLYRPYAAKGNVSDYVLGKSGAEAKAITDRSAAYTVDLELYEDDDFIWEAAARIDAVMAHLQARKAKPT